MIICAAIKIKLIKNNRYVVISNLRHCDCLNTLSNLGLVHMTDFYVEEEGFITHRGDFLNRQQAWEHACNCGQLPVNIIWHNINDELFSEDLY